jgi:general secretion pathway protein J
MARHRPRGFTLPELLVAVALLAIVSLLSYRGLDGLLRSVSATETEAAHWRRIARACDRMVDEIRLAIPSPPGPAREPAWRGEAAAEGDRTSFLRRPRSAGEPVQRVGFRLSGDKLELLHWPTRADAGVEADVLLDDVAGFELRYLDLDLQWRDLWPTVTQAPLPRAVRLRVRLTDGTTLERVVALT